MTSGLVIRRGAEGRKVTVPFEGDHGQQQREISPTIQNLVTSFGASMAFDHYPMCSWRSEWSKTTKS